jgi:hypothetical protein
MNRRSRKASKMERRRLMRLLRPCSCDRYPHDMDCEGLASVVACRRGGYCPQCGVRLTRRLLWDPSSQMAVRREVCRHHSVSSEWVAPEHLTESEWQQLGLVRV